MDIVDSIAVLAGLGGLVGALAAIWRAQVASQEALAANRQAASAAQRSYVEELALTIDKLQEENERLWARVTELEKDRLESRTTLEALRTEVDKLRAENRQLRRRVSELEKENKALRAERGHRQDGP